MFNFFVNVPHCTALDTFICSFLLRFFMEIHENMRVYSRVGRCCLTHFCTVKPNLHRTLERWTEKADHPSPFTFLCVSSCFSFRCFFLTLHQNHFQLACDSERLFSVGPGRLPGHFSGDDECTSLSGTLFRSQTVYSFQIPINYPFSRNNHLN